MAVTDWLAGNQNLDLGPCDVVYDAESGGANLNLGGFDQLTLRFANEKTDLVYAQYGTAPANKVLTGQSCSIEAGLAQASLERCAEVIQGMRLNQETDGTVLGYSFGNAIGEDDLSIAKQADVIKFVSGAQSAETLETISIWKCAPSNEIELTFDAATQRFVGTMFTAYRDDTQLDGSGKGTFFGSGALT